MSYYVDPWLYNCTANPADSPEAQAEQRTIIAATKRALDYARRRGVTLISALGNESTDLGHPDFDDTSPDYPVGTEYERTIDNSCLNLPVEADGVIGVAATGPSGRNAYYSNYGIEQTDISAPGGDYWDVPNDVEGDPAQLILAPYPRNVAEAVGDLNPDGTPNTPFVVQDCKGSGVRLLPVPPGHVDGDAARGRGRRAHRQPVRLPGLATWWQDPAAEGDRGAARMDRDPHCMSRPERLRVPGLRRPHEDV